MKWNGNWERGIGDGAKGISPISVKMYHHYGEDVFAGRMYYLMGVFPNMMHKIMTQKL